MPRVAKAKTGAASLPVVKKKPAKKNAQDTRRPDPIAEGEVITDISKTQWKLGPSIGTGGFGEIYSACKGGSPKKKSSDYNYVVKIEPHDNGTLFVEMHFYMRNARLVDITQFKKSNGLKAFGMPHMEGSGSHDINGRKHRFLVMPRYGKDIWELFLANGRKIPEHTVYRLAWQMLYVYEYIHGKGYIHADLKGANILLGYGAGGASQAYLVDFGLAGHHTQKEFKPEPKKMHNGTIEYTSRDAHLGVATMRGDLEILGYNLINWSGVALPWEKSNLLSVPVKVQKAKESFMDDIGGGLKGLYPNGVPVPILEFIKYVGSLKYNEIPDYEKCRKIFLAGLKALNVSNTGELDFKLKSTPNLKSKLRTETVQPSDEEDEEGESESDELFESKPTVKRSKPRGAGRNSPRKRNDPPVTPKKQSPNKASPNQIHIKASKPSPLRSKRVSPAAKNTPLSAKINFSPVVSIRKNSVGTPSSSRRLGKTIINDNLTPNPRSGKTYEFNFELDVSMDANVVVNVHRKKKAEKRKSTDSPLPNGNSNTPRTRVKVRKMATESSASQSKVTTPRSKSTK